MVAAVGHLKALVLLLKATTRATKQEFSELCTQVEMRERIHATARVGFPFYASLARAERSRFAQFKDSSCPDDGKQLIGSKQRKGRE
mgnify:CR=1 FL=1